ncbi:MAG: carbohydrate porin [Gallionellaceae bacterium]|nr:MAG: carbohydrate porin [Gallionellaceae bacterium]
MRFQLTDLATPFRLAILLGGLAIWPCGDAHAADGDNAAAHFQTTYNWQKHPAFSAAYSGPNSITPGAEEMFTFSATAYLGVRPWRGGEIYFNPEAVEGVPFSTNLIGLGGFTNGEITRAGGRNITLYQQRLFLRQTWDNGGGSEPVESGPNQLAGSIDKNRFVLNVGNFSTLDVLDPNTYAKDPRTQFMNWGNWTYSSYDYAADARGFGWGLAAEWYRDDWALRVARMSGPKEPNGLPADLDLNIHYGDQVEVEHAHNLHGHPGKVRVLGWRNRAKLATFKDALDWLNAHPGSYAGPDALVATRYTEQIKYGLGINIEQEIDDSIGFFLRAMRADGRTETHAFTEVDASLSTGFAIKGTIWGRGEDTAGIAYAQNSLSNDRRRFLEAGGTSFFIGDGGLNYRPEIIFESYYSMHLYKNIWLTPDYQHIQNPAYNADRGPINVFAARFHAEF